MAHQIIKQPNGEYCIFSTVSGTFITQDVTKEEVEQFYVEKVLSKEKARLTTLFEKIDNHKKPYYQFTKTYAEVLIEHNYHANLIPKSSLEVNGETFEMSYFLT